MEKIGQKTRDINFYSEKNNGMICLHSRPARDYAKYLEAQPSHVSPVGIRGTYFQVPWASDFLIYFADGRKGIRELVSVGSLLRKNIVEKLEFSRRYWATTDIDDWKVVLLPEP